MDIKTSFLLSKDLLYTLLQQEKEITKAGKEFSNVILTGAQMSDLEELIEKKMAHMSNGILVLEPVIRLLIYSIGHAESFNKLNDGWLIESKWINIRCQLYFRIKDVLKLMPLPLNSTLDNEINSDYFDE